MNFIQGFEWKTVYIPPAIAATAFVLTKNAKYIFPLNKDSLVFAALRVRIRRVFEESFSEMQLTNQAIVKNVLSDNFYISAFVVSCLCVNQSTKIKLSEIPNILLVGNTIIMGCALVHLVREISASLLAPLARNALPSFAAKPLAACFTKIGPNK